MPSAVRTRARMDAAAAEALRPFPRIPRPDKAAAERLAATCRAHLDTLSPERRAQLEREWEGL